MGNAAELLAVAAHSDAVKRWDASRLSRAFTWARYWEQLHSHATTRRRRRRGDLEKQLLHTNARLRAVFPGFEGVSLPDLSRCQHLLLVGLMNNPELPLDLLKLLLDPKRPAPFPHTELAGLIQCKSACALLRARPDSSPCGADAEVLGLVLMQRLEALLTRDGDVQPAELFLDSVLQGCGGAAGRFCLVVAAALLAPPRSQTQGASQDLLLDWLQKPRGQLQMCRHMCSALPTALLRDLAKAHRTFRDSYCVVLKCWASGMEYSVEGGGEWVHTGHAVTFQRLVEHFVTLAALQPGLRDHVEDELSALKCSDGDFDVRGLSVWGDLLSALRGGGGRLGDDASRF